MRTYSSGMQARLRFAIAASRHAPGPAHRRGAGDRRREFQRRSEKRIHELRGEAGTVFLVSHSLKSIADTCDRALWIDKGILRLDGPVGEVVEAYQASVR